MPDAGGGCHRCDRPLPPDSKSNRKWCSKGCLEKAAKARYRATAKGKATERAYYEQYNPGYYVENREKILRRAKLRTYRLTDDEYDALVARAAGHCEVCGKAFGTKKLDKPNIDHCHDSGVVRGLLCAGCNLTLGTAQDDADRLRSLALYVENFYADR